MLSLELQHDSRSAEDTHIVSQANHTRQGGEGGGMSRLGLRASLPQSRRGLRSALISPRGLGGGTPASTEQSDKGGQVGDTCLDQQSSEFVSADQKYLQ